MVELADAQDLGSCTIGVWVQVPLPAPILDRSLTMTCLSYLGGGYYANLSIMYNCIVIVYAQVTEYVDEKIDGGVLYHI